MIPEKNQMNHVDTLHFQTILKFKEYIYLSQNIPINKFLTVIGRNLVKTQLCEDPNGHELQLEEAKRLLHVDLVKTMARKKNLSSNL